MPRVSEEHLAARRQQILEAAWRCFARQGFHATSMQDVFAESGLSAGAVYRYFPSKADLVRTTAEGILGSLSRIFDDMLAREHTPGPEEAVRTTLDFITVLAHSAQVDRTRIAMHVWSESLHDDEIHTLVQAVATGIRHKWAQLVMKWRDSGDISPDADVDDVAAALYGVLLGFVVQRHLVSDVESPTYTNGLFALLGRSVPEITGRDA